VAREGIHASRYIVRRARRWQQEEPLSLFVGLREKKRRRIREIPGRCKKKVLGVSPPLLLTRTPRRSKGWGAFLITPLAWGKKRG